MKQYDVAIIGSGLAGMSTALYLADERPELTIALISKSELCSGNSALAQGGIAVVTDLSNDSFDQHIRDTLESGKEWCDPEVVEQVIKAGPACINDLESWGVRFDRTSENKLELGLEGGHSAKRIVHHSDKTGANVQEALALKIKETASITCLQHHLCLELLSVENEGVCGVVVATPEATMAAVIGCKVVVLATGGSGQVYQHTTNSVSATGDGIYLAKKVGAILSNMRFVQFHPTAFREKRNGNHFLISEAVRGFGAYVVNEKNERFLFDYDHRGELATRDVVSRAIVAESKRGNNLSTYLDCRHLDSLEFIRRFPGIYYYLANQGVNIRKDLIPVVPVAHYQCGGVKVNECGQTSCERLFAVGECAETGLHGQNRLASNSLLEAVVFAKRVAAQIANTIDDLTWQELPETSIRFSFDADTFCKSITEMIRSVMTAHFTISSDFEERKQGAQLLKKLEKMLHTRAIHELSADRLKTEMLLAVAVAVANDCMRDRERKNLTINRIKMS